MTNLLLLLMKIKVWKKFVSIILSLSLLTNSLFAPLIVLAQEISPSPTPTPTIASTEEPSPSPEVSPSSEAVATPDASPSFTPTDEPAPISQDESVTTPTPDSAPTTPGPPEETEVSTETASATPTITPLQPIEEGELSTTLVQEGESYPIEVLSYDGFTITTDKLDYAPTDTAVITGTNFTSGETYTLTVSSTDEPATSTTVSVTADANGEFIYAYQLDGIYRPNYLVEVKSGEIVVASTTFTDSHIAGYTCFTDVQGANDEPGQKDLTQMCYDYSGFPTTVATEWNWDDTSWSGANTGDACSLFDSDSNGFADSATCVTVENGPPATQKASSPRVFSCNDTRSDRCAGAVLISPPYSTNCSVSQQANNPFDAGNDTVANCTTYLSEVGGSTAQLLDVCSFPSDNPNSDPSDCIRAAARTGKLEVVKDLSPNTDSGLFNLQIDGSTVTANAGDGGTTGEQVVSIGNHTVGETAGTSTLLSNYSTSISCRDLNGTGNPAIASSTDSGPLTVNIADNADVICTITNTLNTGSVTVHKLVDTDGDGSFEGGNTEANTLEFDWGLDAETPARDMGTSATGVLTGTHTVTEDSVADYHFVGWFPGNPNSTQYSCTNLPEGEQTTTADITVTNGQTAEVTFCNAHDTGIIKAIKQTNPDGSLTDFTFIGDLSGQISDGEELSLVVPTGSYSSTETVPSGWTLDSISCDDANSSGDTQTGTATFNVETDEVVTCTFTNTQRGKISGKKFNDLDGDHIRTNTTTDPNLPGWTIRLDLDESATAPNCSEGTVNGEYCEDVTNASGNYSFPDLVPGTYVVSEVLQPGWAQTRPDDTYGGEGAQADGTYLLILDAGEEIDDRDFGNRGALSIFACKYEDSNGLLEGGDLSPVSGWDFTLGDITQSTENGCTVFENLEPGEYTVSELPLPDGWFIADDSEGSRVVDLADENETVNFFNYRLGSINGHKWNDENDDGERTCLFGIDFICEILGGWEEYLEGWTIFIDENDDGILDEGEDYIDTDEDGYYEFTDLEPGTYRVCEEVQSGWVQTYPGSPSEPDCHNVEVSSNEIGRGYDFGNQGRGTIIVEKVAPDSEEEFEFSVEGGLIETIGFVLSDGDSTNPDYSGLPADTYTVTETSNDLYTTTYDCGEEGSGEGTSVQLSLDPGGEITCTFTNTRDTGTITVLKDIDWDESGQIGDHPSDVQGTTSWTWDIAGGEQDIATGDSRTLVTGTYTLSEDLQDNDNYHIVDWTCDNDTSGSTNSIEVNLGSEDDITCTITNSPDRGSILGSKWNDLNGDGVWDDGEPGLEDWEIEIYTQYENLDLGNEQSTETDPDGDYSFEDLIPGNYVVCEVLQEGWLQTYPEEGEQAGVVEEYGICHYVEVGPGDDVGGVDFGNFEYGQIQGYKYEDTNGNGEWDDGEPALEDWEICIDSEVLDGEICTETTGDGYFLFENLFAGDYTVSEEHPDGYQQTEPDGDGTYDVTIISGSGYSEEDLLYFGNAPLSDIHGFKWNDENGDGSCGLLHPFLCEEERLEGWTINLYKLSDEEEWVLETSDITDDGGWYVFENLIPGDYRVCEEGQDGWDQTYPSGSACHEFSLPNGSDQTENEIIGPEYDFGNQESSLGVSIEKSNDKAGGASAGDTVTYTLVVANTGKQTIYGLDIIDALPGGFSYVSGSTTGATTADPTVSGSNLTWENVVDLAGGELITIQYQVKIASDAVIGTYKNFATCRGDVRSKEEVVECDPDDSDVPIGQGRNFGGNLTPQVLGLATELPATGSATAILVLALVALGLGIVTKKYAKN